MEAQRMQTTTAGKYATPTLTKLGALADLTAAGSGSVNESSRLPDACRSNIRALPCQ